MKGSTRWLGGRVIEKFTAEAMFSKPIFGLDFIELVFCVSEVFRKTESLLFRKTSGVYLSWEVFFSSGAHHEENPVGTGTFVIANLLYCLVLWLMDMGLFFGAGVL